ncbi:MAG: hypothetical protein ABIJ35_06350 [Acidobacteriota bacterium]
MRIKIGFGSQGVVRGSQFMTERVNTFDPIIVKELEEIFRDEKFYFTIADPVDYFKVEQLSKKANETTGEVKFPLTADAIRWFIDFNPAGKGFLALSKCTKTDEIVGYYLYFPKRLIYWEDIKGKFVPLLVYNNTSLYVSPSKRGQGVFAKMTSFSLNLLDRSGVHFQYTTPNKRSVHGFLHSLSMNKMGVVPVWIQPACRFWRFINPIVSSKSHLIKIEIKDKIDDSLDPILKNHIPLNTLVWGDRNAELLNWRYRDRPNINYRIIHIYENGNVTGYLIARKMKIGRFQALILCDFWHTTYKKNVINLALKTALMHGEWRDINIIISFMTTSDPRIQWSLWKAGFIHVPSFLLPHPIWIVGGPVNNSYTDVELPKLKSWHCTPYDWDIF